MTRQQTQHSVSASSAREFYMDANASTPLAAPVKEAMLRAMDGVHGNPSSLHRVGLDARQVLDDARRSVAEFMGAASASEIYFTSGATEANTTAVLGLALGARAADPERTRVLVSSVEHPSILKAAEFAREHFGFTVESIPVDRYGRVAPHVLSERIGVDVALVAIMAANNETGCINDVDALARMCHDAQAPFLCDMVQLCGKARLSVAHPGISAAVISGHKFGGPKGIGALYLRSGVRYTPVFGGSQERGRRSGTENVHGIVGLAAAVAESESRLQALPRLRAATDAMRTAFSAEGDVVFNTPVDGLCNTLSVSFVGVSANRLVTKLNRRGIYLSSGSACSSGNSEPSHVLRSLGIDDEVIAGTVRFSIEPSFPIEHLGEAIERIVKTVRGLREQAKKRALRLVRGARPIRGGAYVARIGASAAHGG